MLDGVRGGMDEASFVARAHSGALSVAGAALGLTCAGFLAVTLALGAGASAAGSGSPAAGSPTPSALPAQPSSGAEDVPFLLLSEGTPITAPCHVTVEVDYSPDHAPYNAVQVIAAAAKVFAEATGVRVVVHTGPPASSPTNIDHISIGWVPTLGEAGPGEEVLGAAEPIADQGSLDGGAIQLSAGSAFPATTRAGGEEGVVLHELGHAAGNLGHDASGQMRPDADPARPPGYSPAEKAALRRIFTTDCTSTSANR